jgi:uncharacterized NAD(P)/FAD-binding protein YdhS
MSFNLPFDVAVIGAGASGALLATQFNRLAPTGLRLALVGACKRPARGVAYETPYHANLLNVPAGNMSAYPDERDHFVHWLSARLPGADAKTFSQRSVYGDYLEEILADAMHGDGITLVDGTAMDLTHFDDTWIVHLADGTSLRAGAVVLALGNLLIPRDPTDVSRISNFYHRNPWAADAVRNIKAEEPVVLIGTGLTMVDVALSLREAGHRGPIHAISRHGRLYQVHQPFEPRPLNKLPDEIDTPQTTMRWIRSQAMQAASEGGDWRAVIDSLRPYTARIWRSWTQFQRASFLRHARNLWDIHRHRMAPEIAAQLGELIAQGTLTIYSARIVSADLDGQLARIKLHTTITGEEIILDAARVINCTGPARDFSTVDTPLVAAMRRSGWLRPDQLKLGIETDPDGRLIGTGKTAVYGLYTLGPLRIPSLWESIAIPEIREQARDLAKLLISECVPSEISQTEIIN